MSTSDHKQTQPDVPRLVPAERLAEAWQVAPATVRRWARQGTIPAVRVGKFWRFDLRELERMVREGRKPTGEQVP